jgi:hypothetical protein
MLHGKAAGGKPDTRPSPSSRTRCCCPARCSRSGPAPQDSKQASNCKQAPPPEVSIHHPLCTLGYVATTSSGWRQHQHHPVSQSGSVLLAAAPQDLQDTGSESGSGSQPCGPPEPPHKWLHNPTQLDGCGTSTPRAPQLLYSFVIPGRPSSVMCNKGRRTGQQDNHVGLESAATCPPPCHAMCPYLPAMLTSACAEQGDPLCELTLLTHTRQPGSW